MITQTLKSIVLDPSIGGLINLFIDKTVFLDENSKQVALKNIAGKEIREILRLNFVTVTEGLEFLNPIKRVNISKEAKHHSGNSLPSLYLPANDTQLFAAAIICALGLTWQQLQMNEIALRHHHPNYPYTFIKYLAQNKYNANYYWLSDINKGIRSIDWGSPEQNKAFIQLME